MARSTILVIDDEPNILTTVRRSLELEGYQVEVAGSASTGLARLVEHDIDLVLLDVMMPQETGLEALPKLRAAKPETMVVMMSGNATIETAVQATKAPEFVKRMHDLGYNIIPGSPEQMATMLKEEVARWAPIVKASGAKVD